MSRRHATMVIVIGLAALSIVACRAVVGIEDQSVVMGVADGGGLVEAGGDGAVDGAPPPDAGDPTARCVATSKGETCQTCCDGAYTSEAAVLAKLAKANGCVCNASPTKACTGNGDCGKPGDLCTAIVGTAGDSCNKCINRELVNSPVACKSTKVDCENDPSCAALLACMTACSK